MDSRPIAPTPVLEGEAAIKFLLNVQRGRKRIAVPDFEKAHTRIEEVEKHRSKECPKPQS